MPSALSILLFAGAAWAQLNMCGTEEGYSEDGYRVQNNLWGASSATSGSQCSALNSASSSGIAWSTTWQWAGGENNVKSYSYASRDFTKQLLSGISSIPTSTSWTVSDSDIRADVSYDLFTAYDVNHSTDSGDYELMIWLARFGGVDPIGQYRTSVNIGGYEWDLWSGYNGACEVFSFVAQSAIANFSGDIKSFFNYIADNEGFPISSQNLITLQFGTEPFTGPHTTFDVPHWSADVY